jgi:hypothetical protein
MSKCRDALTWRDLGAGPINCFGSQASAPSCCQRLVPPGSSSPDSGELQCRPRCLCRSSCSFGAARRGLVCLGPQIVAAAWQSSPRVSLPNWCHRRFRLGLHIPPFPPLADHSRGPGTLAGPAIAREACERVPGGCPRLQHRQRQRPSSSGSHCLVGCPRGSLRLQPVQGEQKPSRPGLTSRGNAAHCEISVLGRDPTGPPCMGGRAAAGTLAQLHKRARQSGETMSTVSRALLKTTRSAISMFVLGG